MRIEVRVLENLVGHYTEVLDGCREARDFLKARGIRAVDDAKVGGEVREDLLQFLADGCECIG